MPIPVWIMLVTLVLAVYVLRRTYFGRDVYAVGGNPAAAELSGIKVSRTLMAVYGIVGLAAALGGVIQSARIGAASPAVGEDIIFTAAAAVLLGGTAFSGGVGGVVGTAVGVLFLAALQNGLSVAGLQTFWQQIVTGAILIAAMLLDKAQRDGLRLRRARAACIRAALLRARGSGDDRRQTVGRRLGSPAMPVADDLGTRFGRQVPVAQQTVPRLLELQAERWGAKVAVRIGDRR